MKAIIKNDDYQALLDECMGIISERKFDLAIRDLEWRHELGDLIHNSKSYRESENKTEFVKILASDLGVSYPLIYQCLEFYRKFTDFDSFIQQYNTGKKTIKWSEVRLLLVENPSNCRHEKTFEEKIVIVRQKCFVCGKTLKEEKSKM